MGTNYSIMIYQCTRASKRRRRQVPSGPTIIFLRDLFRGRNSCCAHASFFSFGGRETLLCEFMLFILLCVYVERSRSLIYLVNENEKNPQKGFFARSVTWVKKVVKAKTSETNLCWMKNWAQNAQEGFVRTRLNALLKVFSCSSFPHKLTYSSN